MKSKTVRVLFLLALASLLFAEFSLPGGVVRRFIGKGCDDPGVQVALEPRGGGYSLQLSTQNCTDITLTLDIRSPNTQASRPAPFTVFTRGQQHMELATVAPKDSSLPWHLRYSYHWLYGCPGGEPDGTVYELPFETGTHYRLIQGANGSFSHQAGSINAFANDWTMPEGTRVLAARGGQVVGVRTDSTVHGVADRYLASANYVIIRHADGTYGEYLHLQTASALVKIGDTVSTGQPLARSGNTGYSSGPHLHFCVFRIHPNNTREALPITVRTQAGPQAALEQGKYY